MYTNITGKCLFTFCRYSSFIIQIASIDNSQMKKEKENSYLFISLMLKFYFGITFWHHFVYYNYWYQIIYVGC